MVEILPFDGANKIKLISGVNMARPNQCMICGAFSNEKNYVDVDIVVDDYGYIYICENCGVNIAQVLSCATPDQTEELVSENKELSTKVSILVDRISDLEGALDALSIDRLNNRNVDSATYGVTTASVHVSESDQDVVVNDSKQGRTDSKSSQPVKSKRSYDTSDTTGEYDITALIDL